MFFLRGRRPLLASSVNSNMYQLKLIIEQYVSQTAETILEVINLIND